MKSPLKNFFPAKSNRAKTYDAGRATTNKMTNDSAVTIIVFNK